MLCLVWISAATLAFAILRGTPSLGAQMSLGKLVFAQIMEHLPRTTFGRCVARYRGRAQSQIVLLPGSVPVQGIRAAYLSRMIDFATAIARAELVDHRCHLISSNAGFAAR
jgi:hypothetical protein